MRGAQLERANLTGAILLNADLTDADMTGANMTDAVMTGATFCNTVMPDGKVNNSSCVVEKKPEVKAEPVALEAAPVSTVVNEVKAPSTTKAARSKVKSK